MAAPTFSDRIIEAPPYNKADPDTFRWLYDLWQRTGGFETFVVNLMGLQASVQELNTLVGIDTATTVQAQLNLKFNNADAGTLAFQNADNIDVSGGLLVNVLIGNSTVSGNLSVQVGASTTTAKCGASLHTDVTTVGNTDNIEDNLMTYNLAANSLSVAGDYIDIEIWGTFAANTNNKQVRLYFGTAVVFDSGVIAAIGGSWYIRAKIISTALTNQKSIAAVISSNTLLTPTSQIQTLTQNDSAPIEIKTTALAVAANDVIQEGFTVKWFAAA